MALPDQWKLSCAKAGLSICPEKGVDSSESIYFAYDCGCIGYKQIGTLRRRGSAAQECPEHGDGGRPLSSSLLAVKAAVQHACPELGPVVLEARLLDKDQHPFDMWLPKWQIAAEVDGRQHFRGAMHGKQAEVQRRRDRRVDAKCTQQRLRLLRFHHADDKQWGKVMQWALQQVKENPHCHFIRGTNSYAYEGIPTL